MAIKSNGKVMHYLPKRKVFSNWNKKDTQEFLLRKYRGIEIQSKL